MIKLEPQPLTAQGALLEALNRSMAISEFQMDGTITNANANYLRLSGYGKEELIGQNHRILCTADYVISPEYAEFWRKLRNGDHVSGLFQRQRKDGGLFWVEASYNPVFSAEGRPEKIVKFCTDVTSQKEAFNEQSNKLQAIDRAMLMVEYSPGGIITAINDNFLITMGYRQEELLGKSREVLFSREQWMSVAAMDIWEHVSGGHSYSGQIELISSSDGRVWLEAIYTPLFNLAGKLDKVVLFAVDVTWRVQHEAEEHEQIRQLSLVANETDNAVIIADRSNRAVYINDGFIRMFGYEEEDIIGKPFSTILGPWEKEVVGRIRLALERGESFRSEEMTYSKHGIRMWSVMMTNPVMDEHDHRNYSISVFTDITDTKVHALMQQKALEAMAHDISIPEVLNMICNEAERISPEIIATISGLDENGNLFLIAGPSLPMECGKAIRTLDIRDYTESMGHRNEDNEHIVSDVAEDPYWNACRDIFLDVDISSSLISVIKSSRDEVLGIVSFYYHANRKVTEFHKRLAGVMVSICALALEREKSRATMRQLTFYDQLTGLPNRELLLAKAEKMAANLDEENENLTIMVVGLDRFKMVNQSLGHTAGDDVLRITGRRITEVLKHDDMIGRITGDEFAIVLSGCSAAQSLDIAKRVQKAVSRTFASEGITLTPTASVGISMYPDNGGTIDAVLRNASLAMAEAKKTGVSQVSFFSDEFNTMAQTRISMESYLREAVDNGSLRLFYQPQVYLQKKGLHGVEALCRWMHPVLGNVSPTRFIPLAEEAGIIDKLGEWTLHEGLRQLGAWRKQGMMVPTVSINLSSTSFHNRLLPDMILEMLKSNDLSPADLILELTESILLDANPNTMATVYIAHEQGIRFSMDDFGTGYSSLSYLRHLPIAELKLDQSFVWDLDRSETSRRLSQAVLAIGKSLNLTVVAEGIESEQQNELLKNQGYDVAQGYLQSRPLPPDEFVRWYLEFMKNMENKTQ